MTTPPMTTYTVKQLATLSGVSVRALHYYDEIGLLRPARTGSGRYRAYGRDELLRLQQILFLREMGIGLDEVARLLSVSTSAADYLALLREHRQRIAQEARRYRQLIRTIDGTIADLEGKKTMDTADLYKGFSPQKQKEHEDWLVNRLGDDAADRIARSKAVMAARGPAALAGEMAELATIESALVAALRAGTAPAATTLAPLLDRHRAWVGRMWGRPCGPAAYGGLADTYESHPDFVARFEALAPGFTTFLTAAMRDYVGSLGTEASGSD